MLLQVTEEPSPEQIEQMCLEMKQLQTLKINSSTHKNQWNCLYRLTQPNHRGEAKCDQDIYDRWHKGGLLQTHTTPLVNRPVYKPRLETYCKTLLFTNFLIDAYKAP